MAAFSSILFITFFTFGGFDSDSLKFSQIIVLSTAELMRTLQLFSYKFTSAHLAMNAKPFHLDISSTLAQALPRTVTLFHTKQNVSFTLWYTKAQFPSYSNTKVS